MRRVLVGDVAAVARVLYKLPACERLGRVRHLIFAAEEAHAHMRATGRAHPVYGTGSLMAATPRYARVAEPDFDDADYCACWIMTLDALADRARART